MKKLIATALLAVGLLASPVVHADFVPPGAPCRTVEMDKEALKKNVPNIVFGSIEGEELKKFMDALNSIAARFGKHIDDGAYVLVGKTESRVGYSVYNSKGCQVYYEIVSKETWEKFMDFIFGGSGA